MASENQSFYGTQTITSRLSPLNRRVHNLVLLCPSGLGVLAVKLTLYLWTTKALSLVNPSQLCSVRHLWTDRCPYFIFPFLSMSSHPPLNEKNSNSVILNQLCPVRHLWTDGYSDLTLLLGLRHLWTTNALSLIISNRLSPVRHLWTDEYPNLILSFVVMSSSSPLNNKPLNLEIPNQLCPVCQLWTDEYLDLTSSPVGTLFAVMSSLSPLNDEFSF